MEASSSSHNVLLPVYNHPFLLMMMSPPFKEETSFSIYIRVNPYYLESVLFLKTGFLFYRKRYCYNRDNKMAIFRLVQVIVSSYYYCYSTKSFFQNRELRLMGFACLTAVSATALTVSATESAVSATALTVSATESAAACTHLRSLDLC